ncbi:hypothetical protein B0H13DRAFT_2560630 [Mycena leptocephala]|nr:hypothetical protein B0H13DRAFT_2560630 [Mycena leptocephala]
MVMGLATIVDDASGSFRNLCGVARRLRGWGGHPWAANPGCKPSSTHPRHQSRFIPASTGEGQRGKVEDGGGNGSRSPPRLQFCIALGSGSTVAGAQGNVQYSRSSSAKERYVANRVTRGRVRVLLYLAAPSSPALLSLCSPPIPPQFVRAATRSRPPHPPPLTIHAIPFTQKRPRAQTCSHERTQDRGPALAHPIIHKHPAGPTPAQSYLWAPVQYTAAAVGMDSEAKLQQQYMRMVEWQRCANRPGHRVPSKFTTANNPSPAPARAAPCTTSGDESEVRTGADRFLVDEAASWIRRASPPRPGTSWGSRGAACIISSRVPMGVLVQRVFLGSTDNAGPSTRGDQKLKMDMQARGSPKSGALQDVRRDTSSRHPARRPATPHRRSAHVSALTPAPGSSPAVGQGRRAKQEYVVARSAHEHPHPDLPVRGGRRGAGRRWHAVLLWKPVVWKAERDADGNADVHRARWSVRGAHVQSRRRAHRRCDDAKQEGADRDVYSSCDNEGGAREGRWMGKDGA